MGQHPASWTYGKNDKTSSIEAGATSTKFLAPEKSKITGMILSPSAVIATAATDGVRAEVFVDGVASGAHVQIPEGALANVGIRAELIDAAEVTVPEASEVHAVFDSEQVLACNVTGCWLVETY